MIDERNSTMNITKYEVNKEVKTNPTINNKTSVKTCESVLTTAATK